MCIPREAVRRAVRLREAVRRAARMMGTLLRPRLYHLQRTEVKSPTKLSSAASSEACEPSRHSDRYMRGISIRSGGGRLTTCSCAPPNGEKARRFARVAIIFKQRLYAWLV